MTAKQHDPDLEYRLCRRCGADFRHVPLENIGPCVAPGLPEASPISFRYLERRREEIARRRLISELKEFGC